MALPSRVLLSDSASYGAHDPGGGLKHNAVAVGLGVAVAVAVAVGVAWQKMSSLKVTSESRMSAHRRRCASTKGLICFFTSRVGVYRSSAEHPFAAKREIGSRLFWKSYFPRGRCRRSFVRMSAMIVAALRVMLCAQAMPRDANVGSSIAYVA